MGKKCVYCHMVMKMQKIGFRNVILGLLTAAFIGTGVWMLLQRENRKNTYLDAIASAEYAAQSLDQSDLEARKAEAEALLAEIGEMDQEALALEEEIASLDLEIAKLQQEYDQLAQEEDSAYYLTILQSLTEGMSQVESYIDGDQ